MLNNVKDCETGRPKRLPPKRIYFRQIRSIRKTLRNIPTSSHSCVSLYTTSRYLVITQYTVTTLMRAGNSSSQCTLFP